MVTREQIAQLYHDCAHGDTCAIALLRGNIVECATDAHIMHSMIAPINENTYNTLNFIYNLTDIHYNYEIPLRQINPNHTHNYVIGNDEATKPGEVCLASFGMLLMLDTDKIDPEIKSNIAASLLYGETPLINDNGITMVPSMPDIVVCCTRDTTTPAEDILGDLNTCGYIELFV